MKKTVKSLGEEKRMKNVLVSVPDHSALSITFVRGFGEKVVDIGICAFDCEKITQIEFHEDGSFEMVERKDHD